MLKQNLRREGLDPIPTFLLSFPRSGNTWVRYCVECLTNFPTTTCQSSVYPESWPTESKETNSINNLIKGIKGVREEKPHILVKKHKIFPSEINNYPLILLIRNYKECFIRHYGLDRAREAIFLNNQDIHVNTRYLEMIQYFDKWENEKILFFYEDIILNSKSFIISLSNFFRISNKKLIEDFIQNINFHKKIGLKCYKNIDQISITKGENLIFHSNILSSKEKEEWDNEIEKKDSYIFNKYLKRYSEKYE